MRYRICDYCTCQGENIPNDIYRKFQYQFDNLLTADEIPTNDDEFEELYVDDQLFEVALNNFLKSIRNSARFCVGYTGIGKTTSIRHCLQLGISNVTRLITKSDRSKDKKIIIFPAFFDGARKNVSNTLDIIGRLSSVSTTLEENHPDLLNIMRTSQGREQFYKFIRNHTPSIVEIKDDFSVVDLSHEDEIKARLRHAQQEHTFEYSANKLKYYIKCKYSLYDRLVIVLDDVETLPEKEQNKVIEEYLHLFECMNNTDFPEDSEYRINLLISIRPHTLRIYQNSEMSGNFRRLEAFPVATNVVLKKNAVELSQMFKKRFDYYTKCLSKPIGNKESWDESYKILMTLNESFDGKYKDMILNLCFMNIRGALAVYSEIFANRFWVQGNRLKESIFTINSQEYSFNNINVIRSIGCGNTAAFTGNGDSVIPNFFLSSEFDDDYSIYCLLVMNYFILMSRRKEPTQDITYGQSVMKLQEVRENWEKILGEECAQKLYKALIYLFVKKILRKSIEDVDDFATMDTEDSLDGNSRLYISPLGCELWAMLSRDSVLLEMLRECAWRDYNKRGDSYSYLSSYELLIQHEQYKIFIDLLEYIDYLREQEEKIFFVSNESFNIRLYRQSFGSSMGVQQLLRGVENSLNYSGIMNMPIVLDKFRRIRRRIEESSCRLQNINE